MTIIPVILLVDSEERISLELKSLLESHGYPVTCVSKGREALEYLRSHSVSFIVLDTGILDMNGMELIWKVKGLDPDCPLIVTTKDPSGELEIQAREAGSPYYSRKTHNVEHIFFLINKSIQ